MATESPLNEAQRRRIFSNAQYADKLLSDVEAILSASESKSIFPKYVADLSPPQVKLIDPQRFGIEIDFSEVRCGSLSPTSQADSQLHSPLPQSTGARYGRFGYRSGGTRPRFSALHPGD